MIASDKTIQKLAISHAGSGINGKPKHRKLDNIVHKSSTLTMTCLGDHGKPRATQQLVQRRACIFYLCCCWCRTVCITCFGQNLHQSTDRIVLSLDLLDRCASKQRSEFILHLGGRENRLVALPSTKATANIEHSLAASKRLRAQTRRPLNNAIHILKTPFSIPRAEWFSRAQTGLSEYHHQSNFVNALLDRLCIRYPRVTCEPPDTASALSNTARGDPGFACC